MRTANKALEPTAVGAFIMTITDNITSPTSVTLLATAVAQLGRWAKK
jgi:Na+/proline symporter